MLWADCVCAMPGQWGLRREELPVTLPSPREVVERYFDAMRAGAAGEAVLLSLFDDEAVYIEPFGGRLRQHQGIEAIREAFRANWEHTPPDLTLTVERIDVDAAQVCSTWVCHSPAFPAPVRGRDRCEVRDGKIARLEVTFEDPMP